MSKFNVLFSMVLPSLFVSTVFAAGGDGVRHSEMQSHVISLVDAQSVDALFVAGSHSHAWQVAASDMVRIERAEKDEKAERAEKVERAEKIERPEKSEKAERPEKVEKVERAEKVERPEKSERPEKAEKVEKRG